MHHDHFRWAGFVWGWLSVVEATNLSGAVWEIASPPNVGTTACECAGWLGGAHGKWVAPVVPHAASTSAVASECSLVGLSADDITAPLKKSSTVFLLGNSVSRGLTYTLAAMLNPNTTVRNQREQIDGCGAQQRKETNPQPADFGGSRWPNYNCKGDGPTLRVRHAFTKWFDNHNLNGSRDFLSQNNSKHLANFFWNSTRSDVLFVMLGHNWPHENRADPPDSEREAFLKAVRQNFHGLVVFSTATPVVKTIGKANHEWIPQLRRINRMSKAFFRDKGVPVINTWRFCTAETEHLYADHIHLGAKLDGSPGTLDTTLLRVFSSIVRAARRADGTFCPDEALKPL